MTVRAMNSGEGGFRSACQVICFQLHKEEMPFKNPLVYFCSFVFNSL